MTEHRIQLSRRRGWRLPPGARSVAYPTRWANPHRPATRSHDANTEAVNLYRKHAARQLAADPTWLDPLTGHDLACWCPPDLPCHADVLLDLLTKRTT